MRYRRAPPPSGTLCQSSARRGDVRAVVLTGFRCTVVDGFSAERRSDKMSTMFADTVLIVFISVCTALLAEGECCAKMARDQRRKQ